VEDDALIVLLMKAYMEALGHQVLAVSTNGIDACAKAKEISPDLILMDIRLQGDMTGLEAARIIQKNSPSRILFVTANPHMIEPFIQDQWFHHCALVSKPASQESIELGIKRLFADAPN
jgi:CheY-like chemotaxis protein